MVAYTRQLLRLGILCVEEAIVQTDLKRRREERGGVGDE